MPWGKATRFIIGGIPFDKEIVEISVGQEICIVTADGEAYTIGDGLLYGYGYEGLEVSEQERSKVRLTPLLAKLPEKAKKFIGCSTAYFAIGESGTLYHAPLIQAAGGYSAGAVKDLPRPLDSQVLQKVPLPFKVKDVRQYDEFILALSTDGNVFYWNHMNAIKNGSIGTKAFKINFTKLPVKNIATLEVYNGHGDPWGALMLAKDGGLYRMFYQRPGLQSPNQTLKPQVEKLPLPFAVTHVATSGQSVFVRDKNGQVYGFGNNRAGELLVDGYPFSDAGSYEAAEILDTAIRPQQPVQLDLFRWEPKM